MSFRRAALACALAAPFFFTRSALAQNPRSVPLGGRTATMGGAGVAEGNDSAMPYLNPAGTAGLPGDVFAVSAAVYAYTTQSISRYFHPNGFNTNYGTNPQLQESFSASQSWELPSSVMYFHDFGQIGETRHLLGMSLVTPMATRLQSIGSYNALFTENTTTANESRAYTTDVTQYHFGPTYSVRVGKRLRLGASAYAVYTQETNTLQSTQLTSIGGNSALFVNRTQRAESYSSYSFAPVLGVQFNAVDDLWLGASFAPPSIHIGGSGSIVGSSSADFVDPSTHQPVSYLLSSYSNASYASETPLRASLGIAYNRKSAFAVAADMTYYGARGGAWSFSGNQRTLITRTGDVSRNIVSPINLQRDLASIVDLSVGGELWALPWLAVRVGAFTDFSNVAPFTNPTLDDEFRTRLDNVGLTAGLGVLAGSFDTTIGGVWSHGTGRFISVDAISDQSNAAKVGLLPAVATTTNTFMLVLSGAVSIEDAKRQMHISVPGAK
jgi:hypothetical protein